MRDTRNDTFTLLYGVAYFMIHAKATVAKNLREDWSIVLSESYNRHSGTGKGTVLLRVCFLPIHWCQKAFCWRTSSKHRACIWKGSLGTNCIVCCASGLEWKCSLGGSNAQTSECIQPELMTVLFTVINLLRLKPSTQNKSPDGLYRGFFIFSFPPLPCILSHYLEIKDKVSCFLCMGGSRDDKLPIAAQLA